MNGIIRIIDKCSLHYDPSIWQTDLFFEIYFVEFPSFIHSVACVSSHNVGADNWCP